MMWLEDMVKGGVVRSAEGYLVDGGSGCDEEGREVGVGVNGGIIDGAGVESKGKEKEVDIKMVDITNSKSSLQINLLYY
jgi:hypothetical protein